MKRSSLLSVESGRWIRSALRPWSALQREIRHLIHQYLRQVQRVAAGGAGFLHQGGVLPGHFIQCDHSRVYLSDARDLPLRGCGNDLDDRGRPTAKASNRTRPMVAMIRKRIVKHMALTSPTEGWLIL